MPQQGVGRRARLGDGTRHLEGEVGARSLEIWKVREMWRVYASLDVCVAIILCWRQENCTESDRNTLGTRAGSCGIPWLDSGHPWQMTKAALDC